VLFGPDAYLCKSPRPDYALGVNGAREEPARQAERFAAWARLDLEEPQGGRQHAEEPAVQGVAPARMDAGRSGDILLESRALRRMSEEARARARATREQSRRGRSRWEVLHQSAFARLHARMGTMPVIEQAKGIVMAQQGCRPEEAFDMLRRISQGT